MTPSFNNHRRTAIQMALLVFLAGYSMQARAQGNTVTTVIQQSRESTIQVEYQNDNKMHCTTPVRYIMRKKGTTSKNQVVRWTIRYVPCNQQTVVTQTVFFSIPKGSGVVEDKINIRTRNLVSSYDEKSFVPRVIEEPVFTIAGPDSIMEGDEANLRIQTISNQAGVKWVWAKGSLNNRIATGTGINEKLMSATRFYAYAIIDNFVCSPREYVVQVIKRPDAPSNFVINGPREITDIETATLEIRPNTRLDGVKWIWEQNNQKVGEGLSIPVNPRQTTIYTVHSEYFWKRSPEKSFQLKVRVLTPPPDDFEMAAPARINEGERVWLRIANSGANKSVRWRWTNLRTKEETIADSLLIVPDETTTYAVIAELNGKFSVKKTKTIEVIQKAASPEVVGEFTKCASTTRPLKFTLQGGKLGTGSKYWNWYEGGCGSGKLIHRGNELNISPSKTTTYYVQPENNKTVCRQFTIEVGEIPVLPEKLSAVGTACYDQAITIDAVGNRDAVTKWHWYAKSPGSIFRRYLGEGNRIVDTILATTQYAVVARNSFCESAVEIRTGVEVRERPVQPDDITVIQKKGRQHVLSQSGGRLAPGYQWVWYKDNCDGAPIGYGPRISYRARKSNKVMVRAEGNCEPTACTSSDFTYSKSKFRFIFVNFGLASNNIPNSIYDNNAQFTIGSNSIYLRGRAPLSLIQPDIKKPLGKTELETDNSRITNYPSNTNSYYQFNGETKSELYSLSGGFLLGGRVIKIYLGGGYGKRTLFWGADIFDYASKNKKGVEWARQVHQSISGPLIEGGVLLRFGAFNISGGMNIIPGSGSQTYRAFDAGVGFTFKRK